MLLNVTGTEEIDKRLSEVILKKLVGERRKK